ncbi:hypothetical protein [Allosalinactinospora lopnorensis]|uniref:hypothetical protein n=1 Tax=Allosalinactinospora lopnorensis TaxID=1352348 RepID=UPI0012E2E9C7|nr:hypothetical protein [Allosalinactinospora lopnorensis]
MTDDHSVDYLHDADDIAAARNAVKSILDLVGPVGEQWCAERLAALDRRAAQLGVEASV